MTIAAYTIYVTRVSPWDTGYDLYARANGTPIEEGDGVTVASLSILPYQTSVSYTWTPPGAGTWKFLAIPKRGILTGTGGRA